MMNKIVQSFQGKKSFLGIIQIALFVIVGAFVIFGLITALVPLVLLLVAIELLFWVQVLRSLKKPKITQNIA